MTKREATATAIAPAPAGVTPERVATGTVAAFDIPSIPSVGVHMTEKHAYYLNGDGPVPSVTTILGIMDKPAVGVFKAKEAARAVYRGGVYGFPDGAAVGSEDDVIKFALAQADKVRDTAASLGSSVHLLADLEGMALGASESQSERFNVSDDTIPYLEAYRGFLGRHSASSIVSSEHAVWSLQGYAGTYDLLMMLPHEWACRNDPLWKTCPIKIDTLELSLLDIKTSGKGPYPEWGLQLAGYRWADYIVLENDPVLYPMPQIQRAGVLHLRPDLYLDTGWRLIEYPITKALDYRAFLSALELWRWRDSKRFTKSKLLKP